MASTSAEDSGCIPDDVSAALSRAEHCRVEGRYDDGIELLANALRLGHRSAEVFFQLGNLFADKKDWTRAEHAYRRAVAIDPAHASAMHNLSVVYRRTGRIGLYVKTYKRTQRLEARQSVKEALRRRPVWGRWLVSGVLILVAVAVVLLLWHR